MLISHPSYLGFLDSKELSGEGETPFGDDLGILFRSAIIMHPSYTITMICDIGVSGLELVSKWRIRHCSTGYVLLY